MDKELFGSANETMKRLVSRGRTLDFGLFAYVSVKVGKSIDSTGILDDSNDSRMKCTFSAILERSKQFKAGSKGKGRISSDRYVVVGRGRYLTTSRSCKYSWKWLRHSGGWGNEERLFHR